MTKIEKHISVTFGSLATTDWSNIEYYLLHEIAPDFDTKDIIHISEIKDKWEVTRATSLTLTEVQNVAFVPEGPVNLLRRRHKSVWEYSWNKEVRNRIEKNNC